MYSTRAAAAERATGVVDSGDRQGSAVDRLAPVTALWWTETGPNDAPVVLLLHGGGVGAWMWRDQVEALRARYRVIVPDAQRSHGPEPIQGQGSRSSRSVTAVRVLYI